MLEGSEIMNLICFVGGAGFWCFVVGFCFLVLFFFLVD